MNDQAQFQADSTAEFGSQGCACSQQLHGSPPLVGNQCLHTRCEVCLCQFLFGDAEPTGRLPHTWPRDMNQVPVNEGDPGIDPLFPYGFGLGYPGRN